MGNSCPFVISKEHITAQLFMLFAICKVKNILLLGFFEEDT